MEFNLSFCKESHIDWTRTLFPLREGSFCIFFVCVCCFCDLCCPYWSCQITVALPAPPYSKGKEVIWSIMTDARPTTPTENVFLPFPSAPHRLCTPLAINLKVTVPLSYVTFHWDLATYNYFTEINTFKDVCDTTEFIRTNVLFSVIFTQQKSILSWHPLCSRCQRPSRLCRSPLTL